MNERSLRQSGGNMKKINLLLILLLGLSFFSCYDSLSADGDLDRSAANIPVVHVDAWPNGEIPYSFESNFNSNDLRDRLMMQAIERAMNDWSQAANIKFINVTGKEGNYIYRIYKGEHTESTVGYVENPSLTLNSTSIRSITHELGHCLGLLHEHQRSDRDKYITINWENIQPVAYNQYYCMKNSLYDEKMFAYDYRSIMHYSQYTGNVDWGKQTYSIIDKSFNEKWPSYLSEIDKEKVAWIYGEKNSIN